MNVDNNVVLDDDMSITICTLPIIFISSEYTVWNENGTLQSYSTGMMCSHVFEWKSCACLSPFIAFSVSKVISLVNLLHSPRCSDSHMLIKHHH